MNQENLPASLTSAEFQRLSDVPPEIEGFANLGNASTRRACENALQDFMRFTGIQKPEEFRDITALTSSPGATICCSAP